MNLYELTRSIIDSIPEQQRFSPRDEALLQQFRAPLLALEDELVQGFYDEIEATRVRHQRTQVLDLTGSASKIATTAGASGCLAGGS